MFFIVKTRPGSWSMSYKNKEELVGVKIFQSGRNVGKSLFRSEGYTNREILHDLGEYSIT